MTLRITILPASTQAGKETIRTLLLDKRQPLIHAVYRDPAKAPPEFTSHANFEAAKGDVSGGSELDFSRSDAVFYIPPPTYDGCDTADFARNAANKVKAALQKASSVKRLLLLSAIGAQHDKDIGILKINHISDQILKDSAPEVTIVKPGFFMENWASAFETVQSNKPFFEAYITPIDHKVVMTSLEDISKTCARVLSETGQQMPASPHIIDLHGPRHYNAIDVKAALDEVTGKRFDIAAIEPEQLLDFYGQKVPAPYAQELVEMTTACLPGGLVAKEMEKVEGIARGEIELIDVLRRIASGETTKAPSGVF